MKRIVVGVVVIVMTVGGTIAAVAGQTEQTPTVTMQQSWGAWFVGSATGNALHIPDDSCGELVTACSCSRRASQALRSNAPAISLLASSSLSPISVALEHPNGR